jgi:hypothetical protein
MMGGGPLLKIGRQPSSALSQFGASFKLEVAADDEGAGIKDSADVCGHIGLREAAVPRDGGAKLAKAIVS